MDLDTSDRVVMCYTLEVVDMAGVAEETDMYTDIVGVGTTDNVGGVATHSAEASGYMTNTVQLLPL